MVFSDVDKNDVPFTDDDLRNGRHSLGLLFKDPIRHSSNPREMISINVAEEGHIFYPGNVTHKVSFRDGGLYYDVIGTGSGAFPVLNNVAGIGLFLPNVVNMVDKYGN